MSTPVRLMGDLGGWPVWLDDYESDRPCGATVPANWPMISDGLKADLVAWNQTWISDTPRSRRHRGRQMLRMVAAAGELARRLQDELGDQYDVELAL
jgi:hypothetical protein